MSLDMHPGAADSIRSELAAIGTRRSRLQRLQGRTRVTVSLIAVAAVGVATSAAALLAVGIPGSTVTSALGATTTATHTGPARIDLGDAPAGAGAVIVDLTCLNTTGMVRSRRETGTPERAAGIVERSTSWTDGFPPQGRRRSASTRRRERNGGRPCSTRVP